MFKDDAKEAAEICDRVLHELLLKAPTRGRPGSRLRTAVGDFLAHAEAIIYNDAAGDPLDTIFELARDAEINQPQMARVRTAAEAELPLLLGAVLIKNSLIQFCLASEAMIISSMQFTSRQDVDAKKAEMNVAFEDAIEIAADEMAQMTYQRLVSLHAAVTFYLIETARPLPRMVRYRFFSILPSLAVAHKLYYDSSRADQLRVENKVVHPAFMRLIGRALSN